MKDPVIVSAGLLVYRRHGVETEFLLCHPGGPYWAKKDLGAWTAPKGLVEPDEEPLAAARREFHEETGLTVTAPLTPLSPIRQSGGKHVICWAAEQSLDVTCFRSQAFAIEWPPKSGQSVHFPEVDRIEYFSASEALVRILPSQTPLIREVLGRLS